MKPAKTIIIIVLSVLLAFSVFCNIFIAATLGIKDIKSLKHNRDLSNHKPCNCCCRYNEPNEVTADATTIYNENGVRIVFVEQKYNLMGPALNFYIENYTAQALDILLTDVYIDGIKADFSNLYCDNLPAGKKVYEQLILYESDYEDFIEFPSVVQFVVKIQDPTSWTTIVETEHINICLD